ncbi:MAG: o-succinylbenzoate synthase [bacterium]
MRPFELPLARPLATAHGVVAARCGWLVRLEDETGAVGLGEATPLPAFGTETVSACEAALDRILHDWADGREVSLSERLEALASARSATPCAVAAIDTALHDQAARRVGCTLATWLRRRAGEPGPPAREVEVQALVGGETPVSLVEAAKAAWEQGFRTFKLKLAVSPDRRDLAEDLDRVVALREALGPKARLRLDANEAWTRLDAETALRSLARFDIDYVEQPVAREDLDGLAWLAERSPIPVAADEALLGEGLEACLERRVVPILVVKPAALGGLAPAMRLLGRARESGLRVVWSTLLDGALSRAAVWHLAAGVGPVGPHGLATGGWLARDIAPAAPIASGRLGPPGLTAGVGIEIGLEGDERDQDEDGDEGDRVDEAGAGDRRGARRSRAVAEAPWTGPGRVFRSPE